MRLWDPARGTLLQTIDENQDVWAMAFGGIGQTRLAMGGRDPVVHLWDPETGQRVLDLPTSLDSVAALAWDPEGRRLISAGMDRSFRLWKANSPRSVERIPSGPEPSPTPGRADWRNARPRNGP